MATSAAATHDTRGDTGFFGHPRGLMVLFFTEMWERFSYYGMRALLTLYAAAAIADGGLGMTGGEASLIYGLYGASVYLMSLPGGWIADRFIGQRRAVFIGGVLITLGHITLSMPAIPGIGDALHALPANASFYAGLALVVFGTGLLKPNISTMVGQLYGKTDVRRDAGFTIFYMGINTGALIAPLACGYLAQNENFRARLTSWGIDPNHAWHFGFGLAAIGMIAGLIWYARTQHNLGNAGKHPVVPADPVVAAKDVSKLRVVLVAIFGVPALFFTLVGTGAISPSKQQVSDVVGVGLLLASVVLFASMWKRALNSDERKRLIAMMVLYVGCISFFGVFEQAGGVISTFTENHTQPTVLGIDFPGSYYQSINAAWVLVLAPPFAWLWLRMNRAGREPSPVSKFATGMVFNAMAGGILVLAQMQVDGGHKISPMFLIVMYLFSTMGEMCVSPVGLSSMSKLAPRRAAGMVMGIWFLATSIGYWVAGRAGKVAEDQGHSFLFTLIIAGSLVIAAILFVAAGPIKRMLATAAPEADEAPPAAPLPTAVAITDDK